MSPAKKPGKKKNPKDMTDAELAKTLFPPDVVREVEKEVHRPVPSHKKKPTP
ncbi:MAG TPA: hypothetical protein VLT84_03395 [Acidobacteriota bacterium]|nr:hypothetical protein [Acidobacteriota bacterium]